MVRFRRSHFFRFLRLQYGNLRAVGVQDNDFLLASYPKSGNTWLKNMLVIAIMGENLNLEEVEELVPYVGFMKSRDKEKLLSRGRLFKTHEQYCKRYLRGIFLVRRFEDVSLSYLRAIARDRGGLNLKQLLEEVPSVFLPFSGTSVDWATHTDEWLMNIGRDESWFVVTYESVKRRPHVVLSKVLEFIGVSVEPDVVNFAVESTSPVALRGKELLSSRLRVKKEKSGLSFFVDAHSWEDQIREEIRRQMSFASARFRKSIEVVEELSMLSTSLPKEEI